MTFSFHPDARLEFIKSIDYYENCEPGLGCDFSIQIYSTIRNILAHPHAWPVLSSGEIRRCLINRFPYGIIYCIEEDQILILAVMHLHREPYYWKERYGSSI